VWFDLVPLIESTHFPKNPDPTTIFQHITGLSEPAGRVGQWADGESTSEMTSSLQVVKQVQRYKVGPYQL